MRTISLFVIAILTTMAANAKTLIAYYSYTNNVHTVITELLKQIEADVVRIEPAEKGLDYAADNYAIGSAQIATIRNNPGDEASYPAIDPVDVDLDRYDTVIVAAPLWWSNMAAPLQTFLFRYGKDMAGKNIGLIVSSASSGISGVEADARRLIPGGSFLSPSMWIRSSQTSNAASMLADWLTAIGYESLTTGIETVAEDALSTYTVYSLSGTRLMAGAESADGLEEGIYIINGRKTIISK